MAQAVARCAARCVSQELNHGTQAAAPAPLVLHTRFLIVEPRPKPRCASQVFDRGGQADARGAEQEIDRGAQAVDRGATRCSSQALDLGAQGVARGAARCASQVLNRDTQAAACGAATLP
jgi:hypothetical protein